MPAEKPICPNCEKAATLAGELIAMIAPIPPAYSEFLGRHALAAIHSANDELCRPARQETQPKESNAE